MPIDTVLYNTKLFFRGELVEAGIAIDDGKIVKIAKETNLPCASEKINLNGNITLPGLIDIHVHLRDQNFGYKETFKSGTAAAASGGITTVIDMPNNQPVTMSSSSLKERMRLAKNQVFVNVGFNSAFPYDIMEISEIVKVGAVAFKVYLSNGIGGVDVDDDQSLIAAFRETSKNNVPILVHAEDRTIIENVKKSLEASKILNLMSYVSAHSPEAEARSIDRVISLTKKSGAHVHFCHISSPLGLTSILNAKKLGLPITCEVTPHNLFLSSKQYLTCGNIALTDPPLRTAADLPILWNALKSGSIDVVASDHAPHALDEKTTNSIWEIKPGIPGLETTLPLFLNEINAGRLWFTDLVQLMVKNPVKLLNLKKRGELEEGNWADFVVLKMNCKHTIDSSNFYSKAKYSPFDGMAVKGKPIMTFVNGKLVMDDGEVIPSSARTNAGKILKNT